MLISAGNDQTVRFWDIDSAQCQKVLKHQRDPCSLALNKEGNLITGDRDGLLTIWDINSANVLKEHRGHVWSVYDMLVNRHNQLITASGDSDAFIKVWNLDTLECVRVLKGHEAFVKCLIMKDDLLISGSRDHTIQMYNVETGECLRSLTEFTDIICSMTLDRNGNLISGCGYGRLKLWDIETGVCIRELGYGVNGILCTIIGTRGELIFSSWDRTIKFMDIRSSNVFKTMEEVHEMSVEALIIDGKNRLISSAGDGLIKVWDI